MKTCVPLNKRSKREQREINAQRRADWNGVNPVTRVIPSRLAYNRKQLRHEERRAIEQNG